MRLNVLETRHWTPPPYSIKAWQTANLLKPFSGIQIEDVEMCLLNLCEILLLW